MRRTFELGDLVRRIRSQADIEDSDFVDDDHIKERLSSGLAELYSTLDETGLRYREKVITCLGSEFTDDNQGAGQRDLPRDLQSIIGVDRQEAEEWYELEELMVQERNYFPGSWSGFSWGWFLQDDKIKLVPDPPNDNQVYRILYIPMPPRLEKKPDKTKINVATPDGEQFLVWYVVSELKDKQESDFRYAEGKRQYYLQRVQKWAVLRSFNNGRRPQVRDEYWGGEYSGGRRGRWGGEYWR